MAGAAAGGGLIARPATGRRIIILGSGGAGKTTLAGRAAERLGIPHVELDALHWLENWTPNPRFREAVEAALAGPAWVADGNYTRRAFDLTMGRADSAVWLDYSLATVMWRLNRRIWVRGLSRAELYNGNRENLFTHLFTRDSLYWYVLTTHHRRRRRFAGLQEEYPHVKVVRARRPAEAQSWLEDLPAADPESRA